MMTTKRPRLRALLVLVSLLVTATSIQGQPAGIPDVSSLRFDLLATGLASPVAIAHAGDDRLFIVLQGGRIVVFDDGRILDQPFLDLRDRVGTAGFEQGLLGLAFHPDYEANGRFFVHYTRPDDAVVVSRFTVGNDPDVADPDSEAVLLEVPQPSRNHNGGQLAFGPDGFLYIALGDGGDANDPQCQAQDRRSLLGTILRLDVDTGADSPPHHVPAPGNPFLDAGDFRPEIWAYGLRNPWRFSFDRETGDLYIGDVGQAVREEIDFQPAGSSGGENYGWKIMEGDLCTGNTSGCDVPVPPCDSPELTDPILTYTHAQGCAVIGGYVYRGAAIARLQGFYVFGDFCTGDIAILRQDEGELAFGSLPVTLPSLRSFGEDAAGELLAVAGSRLYRLVDRGALGCRPDSTTLCLNDGRFEVKSTWRTADGSQGAGQAVELLGDAGYFWFFEETNPELFVKLLDACSSPFNTFWVFASGLTDVEVELVVRDTQSGQINRYMNPLGRPYELIRDTSAFATCPGG